MTTRPAFRSAARRRGLFLEHLEDRTAPAVLSTSEVLASVIEVAPVNVRELGATPFARLGIDASRVTPLGHGLVRIATNGADPEALVSQLRATPGIASAQPNYIYTVATEVAINDAKYASQGNLTAIRANPAWDTLIAAGKTLGNAGTTIAIIDEGVNITHGDLSGAIAVNFADPNNGVDDDGNGFIDDINGWDFITNTNNVAPTTGASHGNQVAGIAVARTNNFFNISGIAGGLYDFENGVHVGGARVLPIRVINGKTVTSAGLAAGLNYTASRFVRIANISFDLDSFAADGAVQDAMTNLYNSGCLIVASAGNTGTKDAARGAFDQILFAGGTNNTGKISSTANGTTVPYQSNYGQYVDIMAPSENIWTLGTPSTHVQNSGTSDAAPTVAGVAALLLAQNPSYTRDQLAAKLIGTAVNIDNLNPGYEGMTGAGRVDALNALTHTLPAPTITGMAVNGVLVQDGTSVTSLSTIVLTVPQPLNLSSVTSNSFELRADGKDNTFNTVDDVIVPVTLTNPYRVGAGTLTLSVGALESDHYRFTAKGGSSYLRDPFDNPLRICAKISY